MDVEDETPTQPLSETVEWQSSSSKSELQPKNEKDQDSDRSTETSLSDTFETLAFSGDSDHDPADEPIGIGSCPWCLQGAACDWCRDEDAELEDQDQPDIF